MRLNLTCLIMMVFLAGCLKTRNEVRETEYNSAVQQQMVSMQKANADVGNRFSDLEESIRNLNGRIEVLEDKVSKANEGTESLVKQLTQKNEELSQKISTLQEELTHREKQGIEVVETRAAKNESANEKPEKSSSKKSASFDAAESFFDKKDWKQAILNYQKYRDDNPKGSKFASATLKIGVSFQELGMKDEAKTFYDEVISKFSSSDEARRAKNRLKSLKK